ncbi:MAG: SpoIIE family protein phosphatase [Acidobacteria bacterium]|nr:SpoIIE family protein phosphatase [Acidobacteriota bacterium]
MRVFPRIQLPNSKLLWRRLQLIQRHLTVRGVTLTVELALASAALVVLYTGSRAVWLDGYGNRADLLAAALALILFGLIHATVKRRLLPRIERYFSPVKYDDRRILFDLGQEARAATDIEHLFKLIVAQIAAALQAEDVSIFVRDEKTGNYLCRVSSSESPELADALQPTNLPEPLSALSRQAFVVRRLGQVSLPLEIGQADFDAWARAFETSPSTHREARRQEQQTLLRFKTRLLQPIKIKEQLVGILSLGQCRVRHEYTTADKEMLMSVASQLALVIENARLTERMLADERLRRELALAAEVQKRLLPSRPPECLSVEVAGFCQPARGIGGDYYDFFKFDNQQLGIAIADVAGKGIAAALLMSTVQAILRSLSLGTLNEVNESTDSLANMVGTLNRLLFNSTGGSNYVTFFYAQFDQSTQQLAYVNAGHNPPFLFRANGDGFQPVPQNVVGGMRKLEAGGMFVGMFDHLSYEQEIVQMQSGDVLIAFTDGLPEAQNTTGEEFGDDRIQEALAETASLPVNEIRDEILQRVQAWCADAAQYDDLTFIVLKAK